jgi:hypothetical protein
MVFKKSFLFRVTYRTLHFSKWKAIFHFSYDTASLSRCCCKRHNLFIYFTARYAMLSYAKSRMMETLADLFHRGLVYDILHPVAKRFAIHVFCVSINFMFTFMQNSNMTSFFHFVNTRAIYRLGIISLAHAPVHVTDFPVVNVHVDELLSARICQHKLCATFSASVIFFTVFQSKYTTL